ncbi:MAG: DDE-type integrase/transposase/recombinase [Pseudomonadota bacterium]
MNDGSCVRLRPEHRDHVWSYDFVHCRTDDGKVFRTLNIIDEYSRECLAIRVDRRLDSGNVIDVLSDLFILPQNRAQAQYTTDSRGAPVDDIAPLPIQHSTINRVGRFQNILYLSASFAMSTVTIAEQTATR